jgi:predicted kinase
VLDAVFLDAAQRAAAERAARDAGVPFDGLWLEAPLDVLRARIAARQDDASDATEAVLLRAAAADTGTITWRRIAAGQDATPAALAALGMDGRSMC